MISMADLQEYVRAGDSDYIFMQSCVNQAVALVGKYNKVWDSNTSTYVASAAPLEVVDRAVLECGSELFHRRNAPNGVAQFASFDGAPVRVARDPMVGAYPLLNPYLVVGI